MITKALAGWLEGYRCSQCKSTESDTIDSRVSAGGRRRRRQCKQCGHRWTSYEVSEESFGLFAEIGRLFRDTEEMSTALIEKVAQIRAVLHLVEVPLGEAGFPGVEEASPADSLPVGLPPVAPVRKFVAAKRLPVYDFVVGDKVEGARLE